MKPKMKIKMGIDFLMTALLLCLMAYQITGQKLHEWFGAGMLLLFLAHNMLNLRWYENLGKGRYKLIRVVQTIVNLSVLIAMLCLGYSGVILSRHVFAPIHGPMATARMMHMAASYWGFVLMSIHLGMHWGMVVGMFRKLLRGRKLTFISVWGLRITAVVIAAYGLFCFTQKDIVSYMFLKNQFVFFDFEQSATAVFLDYIAMMSFWVFTSFYTVKGIGLMTGKRSKRKVKNGAENGSILES